MTVEIINNGLNDIKQRMNIKNDAALCRVLGIAPPVISKIRKGKLPPGAVLVLRMHEEFDIPVREIKSLLGMPQIA